MRRTVILTLAASLCLAATAAAQTARTAAHSYRAEADIRPLETNAPQVVAVPKVDISIRNNRLYTKATKTGQIDPASEYVQLNGTITVKKSDGLNCNDKICTFLLGFIAMRDNPEGDLLTQGTFETIGLIKNGMKIPFKAGQTAKPIVHYATLKFGANVIYLILDPTNITKETNENNNYLRATIILER